MSALNGKWRLYQRWEDRPTFYHFEINIENGVVTSKNQMGSFFGTVVTRGSEISFSLTQFEGQMAGSITTYQGMFHPWRMEGACVGSRKGSTSSSLGQWYTELVALDQLEEGSPALPE